MTFPDITPDLKAAMPELRGRLLANQSLAELTWSSHFGSPAVTSGLIDLYQAAVATLTAGG